MLTRGLSSAHATIASEGERDFTTRALIHRSSRIRREATVLWIHYHYTACIIFGPSFRLICSALGANKMFERLVHVSCHHFNLNSGQRARWCSLALIETLRDVIYYVIIMLQLRLQRCCKRARRNAPIAVYSINAQLHLLLPGRRKNRQPRNC